MQRIALGNNRRNIPICALKGQLISISGFQPSNKWVCISIPRRCRWAGVFWAFSPTEVVLFGGMWWK